MFPPGTIDQMRALNDAALPDLCDVLAPGSPKTKPGGYRSDNSPTIERREQCRVAPFGTTPREQALADRIAVPERTWLVVFSVDTALPESDRLLIITSEQGWSKTMKVIGVPGEFTSEVMRKVIAEEVSDGA